MSAPGPWQLPRGVTRGMWDYTRSDVIAQDYDEYFSGHGLFAFDQQILNECFRPGQSVADLGAGTGRALLPLSRQGIRGLAIDLSPTMLAEVKEKAQSEELTIWCLRANLVELDCLRSDCVDGAICMFSTLGMIRGQSNRQEMLEHVRRIVRPGGTFVLHAYNLWFSFFDPGGPLWVLRNICQSLVRPDVERGDRYFPYRGVANMYLHNFTRRELVSVLRRSGFRVSRWHTLGARPGTLLSHRWWMPSIRASGWIVVCQ